MKPNTNPDTGIAFGVIGAHVMEPDLVDQLLFGQQAVNVSYETAKKEYVEEQRRAWDSDETDEEFDADYAAERFADRFQCDEPRVEGEYEGVKYATAYFGGALHFFILESPYISTCVLCSPCAPGAGDLHNTNGSILTYDVPLEWRA